MWIALISLLIPMVQSSDKHPDYSAMQGEWGCTQMIRDGVKMPEDVAESRFRDVKDDAVSVSIYEKVVQTGKYKLNPNVTPKQIDVTISDGPLKDKVVPGIYEFKGEELIIIAAQPGKDRPTSFECKEGSGLSLSVWKKMKK